MPPPTLNSEEPCYPGFRHSQIDSPAVSTARNDHLRFLVVELIKSTDVSAAAINRERVGVIK